ncbi:MAG: hypothetical protein AB7U73_12660 [Pirellulales bacterium]
MSAKYDPARPDSGTRAMIVGDRPLPHETDDHAAPLPDPEPAEVRNGPIIFTGVALLMVMVVGIVVCLWLMRHWGSQRVADQPPLPQGVFREKDPKAPLLQVSAPQSMSEMRAREAEQLQSYGWVDRQQGVVHIPLERAIDKYLEKQQPPSKEATTPEDQSPSPAGTKPSASADGAPANEAPENEAPENETPENAPEPQNLN